MQNPEIRGLAAIVNIDTLHTIEGPPSRSDYKTDSEFNDAYETWWINTCAWQAKRIA